MEQMVPGGMKADEYARLLQPLRFIAKQGGGRRSKLRTGPAERLLHLL